MRRASHVLAGLALALLSIPGFAAAQGPTFRAGTERVRVDVLVTDDGEPVMGLGARDFRVLDNGVVQKPDLLEAGGPIKVLLVLDTSSSVKGVRFEQLVAASGKLLDAPETRRPGWPVAVLGAPRRASAAHDRTRSGARHTELRAAGATDGALRRGVRRVVAGRGRQRPLAGARLQRRA